MGTVNATVETSLEAPNDPKTSDPATFGPLARPSISGQEAPLDVNSNEIVDLTLSVP